MYTVYLKIHKYKTRQFIDHAICGVSIILVMAPISPGVGAGKHHAEFTRDQKKSTLGSNRCELRVIGSDKTVVDFV